MKEIVFLNKNVERWNSLEQAVKSKKQSDPDFLADSFIKLTDDLAFAQTYYSGSETERYLNFLTSTFHKEIYKIKSENAGRFLLFWKYDFPLELVKLRKYMLYAFIIFIFSFSLGVISANSDINFVRIILGDEYVNMTIENIKNGDAMAVYKGEGQMLMFLGIAKNNLAVMTKMFLFGLLTSLFTGLMIVYNGIMVGAFQYFFYKYNVLLISASTIWLHGTIEMFTLIVSGAAGIMLGNSLTFPGTYTRKQSLINAAKKGVKILIGLVPFIIFAAFIESFITRHTEWSYLIKFSIIGASLFIIVYYFFIYPYKINEKLNTDIEFKEKINLLLT